MKILQKQYIVFIVKKLMLLGLADHNGLIKLLSKQQIK